MNAVFLLDHAAHIIDRLEMHAGKSLMISRSMFAKSLDIEREYRRPYQNKIIIQNAVKLHFDIEQHAGPHSATTRPVSFFRRPRPLLIALTSF